jgi:hypothetical protein
MNSSSTLILILIAFPLFKLYLNDENRDPNIFSHHTLLALPLSCPAGIKT